MNPTDYISHHYPISWLYQSYTESLDLKYLNDKEEEIPKERLSAGEKQLMVVSLLWALAICSNRKLPVIIDTPLSRLDSKHRMALIKTYFPNASDQTIVLSTDSEIYGKYYKALKKNVGNSAKYIPVLDPSLPF